MEKQGARASFRAAVGGVGAVLEAVCELAAVAAERQKIPLHAARHAAVGSYIHHVPFLGHFVYSYSQLVCAYFWAAVAGKARQPVAFRQSGQQPSSPPRVRKHEG